MLIFAMGTGMNNTTLKVLITAKRSLEYKEMSMVDFKQHLYIGDFFKGKGMKMIFDMWKYRDTVYFLTSECNTR